ncbi:MAG: filamentous hemagglutinin family protein [Deltaproteobacteria bacterium]|nr:filamentous hemagglutinin family protein [Deltaproteobacteria bacterium]
MKKARRLLPALGIAAWLAWVPAPALCGPTIPGLYSNYTAPLPNALPVPKTGGTFEGNWTRDDAINKLTVNQNKEKAVFEWDTFNIGEKAWTHFNQENSDWVALNRIYDANPSMIFGKLTADGKVYLINHNGILFGPSSRVNVHSLIASSLQMTNKDFLDAVLRFKAGEYDRTTDTIDPLKSNPNAVVSNHGEIETDVLGSVFLLAPRVENAGSITSPSGQIGLAAGEDIEVNPGNTVTVNNAGAAVNYAHNLETGSLIADTGLVGMYGREVWQEGLIRSVTAIKKGGSIELRASDRVYTGEKSLTTTAISNSTETAHSSFPFEGGRIDIGGLAGGTTVGLIEHWGEIVAPAGTVNLLGENRVFLGSGSLIDVSGSWVDLPAEAVITSVQLNSNELRDAFSQKGGLLQGEKIEVNKLTGSTIGDLSEHLDSEEVMALERSTYGGRITIRVTGDSGDIIMKEGARIHFSGGGIRYGEGHVATTKLLAGKRLYDINEAPEYMLFDRIMGLHETYHQRYGVVESFEGLYMGGASPVKDYWAGHVEARDAGTLMLIAKRIVLDGEIKGSVEKGLYQKEASESEDENEKQTKAGLREPAGGTLIIGDPLDDDAAPASGMHRFVVDSVIIKADATPAGDDLGPDPVLFPFPEEREGRTLLSAEILNAAGLSNLQIYTNGLFETEADARVSLRPGNWKEGWVDADNKPIGRFYAVAGSILHRGEVSVPAGTIRMIVRDTMTDFPAGEKKVVLPGGSRLNAAGERIDNSLAGQGNSDASIQSGHIHGGSIRIADETAGGQGVFILPDAQIDVSGGYEINEEGKVSGGDAGALEIAGPTLFLLGEVKGLSLPGKQGGRLSLSQNEFLIMPFDIYSQSVDLLKAGTEFARQNREDTLELLNRYFVLNNMDRISTEQLTAATANIENSIPLLRRNDLVTVGPMFFKRDRDSTGFAHIELMSLGDLVVEPGVNLEPSWARLPMPEIGPRASSGLPLIVNLVSSGSGLVLGPNGYVFVEPMYAGDTSITLLAGKVRPFIEVDEDDLNLARITLHSGSRIAVAPGGEIQMKGPGIDIQGELKTLSGTVSLTATYADLRLGGSSRILATGFNKPETTAIMKGLPTGYDPQPGGAVSLTAGSSDDAISGNLVIEPGASIDVSGSDPVATYVLKPEGGYSSLQVAGAPGSIGLAYRGNLILQGELSGRAKMEGMKGGGLSLSHLNNLDNSSLLKVTGEQLMDFTNRGFDDLTFKSAQRIALAGPMDLNIGRCLTLDAPHIEGLGEGLIRFHAPWIRVVNTRGQYLSEDEYNNILKRADTIKEAGLHLDAGWMDMEGSVLLTGFESVMLEAEKDMSLTENYYRLGLASAVDKWEGLLKTTADLTLKAGRIYPTTLSDFTILGGSRVTILPGDRLTEGPVPSAGGSLTIEADNIYHGGHLAAPFGSIALRGDYETGEVLLQPGSAIVTAGELPVLYGTLEDLVWRVPDKSASPSALGLEVTGLPQKSVEITGRSVLLQEGSRVDVSGGGMLFSYLFQPGLDGSRNPLTKKGRYVIMPGLSIVRPGDAMVLEGAAGLPAGAYSLLPEWFAFLPGAMVLTDLAESGEGYSPGKRISREGFPVVQGYETVMGTSVRSPISRGFSIRPASDVIAEGHFTVAEAQVGAAGSVKVQGKTAILDGTIRIQSMPGYKGGTIALGAQRMAIGHPTDEFLPDLILEPTFFSEMDLEEIRIGDRNLDPSIRTEEVRMYAGGLQAPKVVVSANGNVTLMPGAEIRALDETKRLDHLIYRYDYDPQVGIGIVDLRGIRISKELGLWQAEIGLKGRCGVEALELVGDDQSILKVLHEGETDLPVEIHPPTFVAACAVGGLGEAALASRAGTITLKSGSLLHASHEVSLDGRFDLEDGSVVESDHSTLNLSGSIIYFYDPSRYTKGADGLYLTQTMWNNLSSFDDITLKSESDLIFLGDYSLASTGRLTIDAARLAGSDGDETVSIFAPELSLVNTGSASIAGGLLNDDLGVLSLSGGLLEIGIRFQEGSPERKITIDGFKNIEFASGRDLIFKGRGALDTSWSGTPGGGGDLSVSAARVTTSLYSSGGVDGGTDYVATDIRLDAGGRMLAIEGNGGLPLVNASPGGSLELSAGTIRLGKTGQFNPALIEMPSGIVRLKASNSVYLHEGAVIALRGTDYAPGGALDLRADSGTLDLAEGSLIDVSAGSQGDAGSVALYAPGDGVILNGELLGHGSEGAGGSFSLDANQIGSFNKIYSTLAAGGFDREIAMRARAGDVELGSPLLSSLTMSVDANRFKLVADAGSILLNPNVFIDASGKDNGGRVELHARDLVMLLDNGQPGGRGATITVAGKGEGAAGGEISLGSSDNYVVLFANSLLDVSSGEGGTGGAVNLRAKRYGNDVLILPLGGIIRGASGIYAEAFETYSDTSITTSDINSWKALTQTYMNNAGTIENRLLSGMALQISDGSTDSADKVHLVPSIEIENAANLTLTNTWDLKAWRYGDEPGRLTLRAGGNLNINADITDAPSSRTSLFTNVALPDTWGIRLIAGADLQGADPMAIITGVGDLTMANEKVVYTENADIRFAAGRDAVLLHGKQGRYMINNSMTYNLGTYRGSIYGTVARDLKIGGTTSLSSDRSGGIQTALGDIEIDVGRDLLLISNTNSKSVGIRTTGGIGRLVWQDEWKDHPELWPEEYKSLLSSANSLFMPPFYTPEQRRKRRQDYLDTNIHGYYHMYGQGKEQGGDIRLRVRGNLLAQGFQAFTSEAWDYACQGGHWAPAYERISGGGAILPSAPVGGLAAMAGGDLRVWAGGRFESMAGAFGKGDVSVFAVRDVDGKFLVKEGRGDLTALGNFGLRQNSQKTIETFDGDIAIFAQGNAVVGKAINPTTREGSMFDKQDLFNNQLIELRYAQDASLRVKTLLGDVTLPTGGLFPPILDVEAGGSIHVENALILAPSRSGQLRMVAGGDIDGLYGGGNSHAEIFMSDMAPEAAYAYYPMPSFEYTYPEGHAKAGQKEVVTYLPTRALIQDRYRHGFPSSRSRDKPGNQDYFSIYRGMVDGSMSLIADEDDRAFLQAVSGLLYAPVHLGENTPIEIRAGGSIRDITLTLPKQARISAGGSIRDIFYLGQNNSVMDLSTIQAKGDIVFQKEDLLANYLVGIEQAGPGFLAVQAGNNIDLGETRGIKSIGDVFNGYLGDQGSSLIVMSGMHGELEKEALAQDVAALFQELRTAGVEFSKMLAQGRTNEARRFIDAARQTVVGPFLEGYVPGKGEINMITSQIGSDAKDTELFILARGEINVGKSTFFAEEEDRRSTGIYTALGGGINIFSRGDVNVNESRIMTYMGGDITIWSDEGNINAGKGSKAAINVDPPKLTWVGGVPVVKFIPPAVGSGIRCLTYDPDGYEGPQYPPNPGDIYLTAPMGIIDAGEAGISGGNLFLGATQVLNAQNIEAVGVSVGVPTTTGSANLGALSGAGELADAGKMSEQSSALASSRAEAAAQAAKLAEEFMAKWVEVRVVAFDTGVGEDKED